MTPEEPKPVDRPVTCADIGFMLAFIRKTKRLTYKAVAEATGDGLHWSTVKFAEENPESVTMPLLLSLCRGLDVPVDTFMVIVGSRCDHRGIGAHLNIVGMNRALFHLNPKMFTPKRKKERAKNALKRLAQGAPHASQRSDPTRTPRRRKGNPRR